jgi:hypothetical protein
MQSEAEYTAGLGRKISEFNRGYMRRVFLI